DAIDFAQAHADIDAEQVYVVGFSGGGMMSLIMAGRHADRFAGAVSWVPIYNLVEWAADQPRARYVADISASCGGNPLGGGDAWLQCTHRSPSTHLNGARTAGIPVFIGHGSTDGIVYPDHSVRAFNQLADPEDRLTPAQSDAIGRRTLPAELRGQIGTTTYFRGGDPTPVFARQSGPVRLVLFSGGHAGVFNPGLEWMVNLRAAAPPSQVVRDAVSRLYVAYFDREPDTAGLGYWTRVYAHGRSLSSISSHFAVSPEFVGRYGDVDDEGFVRLVYANVLGRDPDGGGLAYWTGVLESGRSRGSLMVGFSQSAEFRALTGTT
ncbi:MAG TPA: DUF4214 domain-containing protein, partial [Acidimicrobiales bacterium]|nr:DUF4214 domain-containing protein [Acidimicrobiales bacterium]